MPPSAAEACPPPPAAPGPSLTTRVVKGTAWVFAGKMAARAMQLVQTVVLARLLGPGDFGLFGIVMLAIIAMETFTQTGFDTALIQRKGNTEDYLDTAWTVQVVRGAVLAGLLCAAAPLVGWFFEEPRAVALLRVAAVSVAVVGLVNVGVIYFQKELQFRKQFVYDLLPAAFSLAVGVVLAYRLRSVWALVWAGIAAAAARAVLSYVIHPYRPRVRFERGRARELFRFGRWLLGARVIIFLALNGDAALVGKVFGAAALGVYRMAYRLSNVAATDMAHVTGRVMMPAYAMVQDDRGRLGRGFLQVFELILLVALPLTVFFVVGGRSLVLGLLGERWADAVRPLQILAVAGFLRAVVATGGVLFVGTGRPHMEFWLHLCRTLVMVVAVYPLSKAFGLAGAAFGIILSLLATLPIWARVTAIAGVTLADLWRRCRLALVLAALTGAGVGLGSLPRFDAPALTLAAEVAATAVLCGAAVWVAGRFLQTGPLPYALRVWKAMRAT